MILTLEKSTNHVSQLPKASFMCMKVICFTFISYTIKKSHRGGLTKYFDVAKTLAVLQEHFHCSHMIRDVECMVECCGVCHRAKSKVNPFGLYTPLPIPTQPWVDISMDFVLGQLYLCCLRIIGKYKGFYIPKTIQKS